MTTLITYPVKIINRGNIILDKLNINILQIEELLNKYNNSYIINWYNNHGNLDTGLFEDIFYNIFTFDENIYIYIFTTETNYEALILKNMNIIMSVNNEMIEKKNNTLYLNEKWINYLRQIENYNIYCTGDECCLYNLYDKYNIVCKTCKNIEINNGVNLSLPFNGFNIIKKSIKDKLKNVNNKVYHTIWIGNITNERKERSWFKNIQKMLCNIDSLNNLFLNTNYFFTGLSREEYYNKLLETKFSWCLNGVSNIDTFRVYESLECFCIPIVPKSNYWENDEYKFVLELECTNHNILQLYKQEILTNELFYVCIFNKLYSNWRKHIWKQSTKIIKSMIGNNLQKNNNLTALITSSPSYDNPSTNTIEQVLDGLYAHIDIPVVIVFDGLKNINEINENTIKSISSYEYHKYDFLLLTKTKYSNRNILPVFCNNFGHQSSSIIEGLKFINTDNILFLEHDCVLREKIDIKSIIEVMYKYNEINMVQFHCNSSIYKNKNLEFSEDWGENGELLIETRYKYYDNVPLLKTCKYSARPHIIKIKTLNYLLQFVNKEYIEDKIYGIALKNYEEIGMYIYYPPKGDPFCIEHDELGENIDIRRHTHLDGRQNMTKIYNNNVITEEKDTYGLFDKINIKDLSYYDLYGVTSKDKLNYCKFMEKISYDSIMNWHKNIEKYNNPNFNKIFIVGFNKTATRTISNMFVNCNNFHQEDNEGKSLAIQINNNFINGLPLLHNICNIETEKYVLSDMEGGSFIEYSIFKFFPLLDSQYPGSKFILNFRNKKDWILSRLKHEYYADKKMLLLNMSVHELISFWDEEYETHMSYFKNYFIRDTDNKRENDFKIVNIDDDNWQNELINFFEKFNIKLKEQPSNLYKS